MCYTMLQGGRESKIAKKKCYIIFKWPLVVILLAAPKLLAEAVGRILKQQQVCLT